MNLLKLVEFFSLNLCASAILFSFLCLLLSTFVPRWKRMWRFRNLPPGPGWWHYFGSITSLDLEVLQASSQRDFKKYGSLYSLSIGVQYLVITNEFEILKKFQTSKEYSSRPKRLFHISPKQTSIFSSSGEPWKEQRKLYMNTLRLLGTGTESFRSIFREHIEVVLQNIKKKQMQDLDLNLELDQVVNNVSFQIYFGRTFSQGHHLVQFLGDCNREMGKLLDLSTLKTFNPWLGFFVSLLPYYRNIRKQVAKLDDVLRQEIKEHQKTLDSRNPRDFIDYFLLEMERNKQEIYNIPSLLENLKLLLAASSDTTRTTLIWFLLFMAKYPEVQERIQKDIDEVLGIHDFPLYDEKYKLPLLEAAIMESMRMKNLGHFSFPRQAIEDTKLKGFDIPKGTLLFTHLTSLCYSSEYWNNPEQFDPSRFLTADRKTVQVPDHFIAFSYGKRCCPGEKTARALLFELSGRILQNFKILPPKCGIQLANKFSFVVGQKHPYVRFQWRDHKS